MYVGPPKIPMASGTNATLIYYIKVYYMYIKVLYHIGFMMIHVD